jgi:polysaccharide biosynthesis/export protein
LGAAVENAAVPFTSDRVTLAEALGLVGGLNDLRADPGGAFIFRYEDPEVFRAIRRMAVVAADPQAVPKIGVPVIYRLNMKKPQGLFVAQRFLMRDNDILYVSNATSTELQKFLAVLTGTISSANLTTRLTDDLRSGSDAK